MHFSIVCIYGFTLLYLLLFTVRSSHTFVLPDSLAFWISLFSCYKPGVSLNASQCPIVCHYSRCFKCFWSSYHIMTLSIPEGFTRLFKLVRYYLNKRRKNHSLH
uniref:Putative secreted protein n=1 Tax=Amblyomma cajennense TaxID=34607 RepID=A0A023FBY2_AMBCJ